MADGWDAYWGDASNRLYWEQPDKDVVSLLRGLDRAKVRDVLDLGCGTGRHTFLFVQAGFNVIAVDSSQQALNVLKEHLAESMGVTVIRGNYGADLFAARCFDLVIACNVLYHGTRDMLRDVIFRIHCWLRPGGLFYFTCPTRRDAKYGNGECVAPHTFRPINSVHPGDIHYFADETDIKVLTAMFEDVTLYIDEHYWDNQGTRQLSSYWQVLARNGS